MSPKKPKPSRWAGLSEHYGRHQPAQSWLDLYTTPGHRADCQCLSCDGGRRTRWIAEHRKRLAAEDAQRAEL